MDEPLTKEEWTKLRGLVLVENTGDGDMDQRVRAELKRRVRVLADTCDALLHRAEHADEQYQIGLKAWDETGERLDEALARMVSAGLCRVCGGSVASFCNAGHHRCACEAATCSHEIVESLPGGFRRCADCRAELRAEPIGGDDV